MAKVGSKKVLIYGVVPYAPTGYGKNTKNLMKRLKRDYEVYVLSFNQYYGSVVVDGVPVLHTWTIMNSIPNSLYALRYWARVLDVDMVVAHFDLWTLGGEWISKVGLEGKVYSYTPVDQEPIPPLIVKSVENSRRVLAMSRFAEKMFADAGVKTDYVPHAVETKIYRPLDKNECRKSFGVPENSFVFGVVATNIGPRKNLPNILKAFKIFLDNNPDARKDAFLYLHTYVHHDVFNIRGYELPLFWKRLGIERNVLYTHPEMYLVGLTEDILVRLYNSFDVLVETTLGEGFGLPIIEAGACGVPSIVTDFSAMPELVKGAGWTVKPGEFIAWELTSSWQAVPDVHGIADAMSEAYNKDGKRRRYGSRMLMRVREQYDWDYVYENYWHKLLKEDLGQ